MINKRKVDSTSDEFRQIQSHKKQKKNEEEMSKMKNKENSKSNANSKQFNKDDKNEDVNMDMDTITDTENSYKKKLEYNMDLIQLQLNYLNNFKKKKKEEQKSTQDTNKQEVNNNNNNNNNNKTTTNNSTISGTVKSSPITKTKDFNKDKTNSNKDENQEKKTENKISHHSKNYNEHVYRLKIKRYIKNKKGQRNIFDYGFLLDKVDDVFSNFTMELIKKSLEITSDLYINVPFPLNNIQESYIKIYKLLSYTVSDKQQLKDIDGLTRILFNYLLECRNNIQLNMSYCCKKLNKRPMISISFNNISINSLHKKYNITSDRDLMALSNILDYQWSALEFLLQRMDKSYCLFRIRNKHILSHFQMI